MTVCVVALIERAIELGSMSLAPGSPVLLARSQEFKRYFDCLVEESRPARLLHRRAKSILEGRLRKQLLHDQARQLVLELADADSGATAEVVLAAIRHERSAWEYLYCGRPLNERERLALTGLPTADQRGELSELIRDGLLRTDGAGFSSSAALRRKAAGWLFVALIGAGLGLVLSVLSGLPGIDPWYVAVHVIGTAFACWWFSKDIFAAARASQTAVHAANMVLRPKLRWVRTPDEQPST